MLCFCLCEQYLATSGVTVSNQYYVFRVFNRLRVFNRNGKHGLVTRADGTIQAYLGEFCYRYH